MGTFGAGIFDDDVAADVRREYLELLASGSSDREACRTIEADWKDSIADRDDGPVFWLALAAIQWEYGRLSDRVKRRALEIINSGKAAERWTDSPHAKRRHNILQRLKAKLQLAQPKRRTPRRKFVGDPDSFSVKSPDQTAAATAWTNDARDPGAPPFSQVYVLMKFKRSEGGGGVFTAHCHCTAIRLKWLDNDCLRISYPKDITVDRKDDDCQYFRRTIAIKYRRY